MTASAPDSAGRAPSLRPFVVPFESAALEDLRTRIARTRWPRLPAGIGWSEGTDPDFLRELLDAWLAFDWEQRVKELNALPQFVLDIGGHTIHFVHVEGRGPAPTPLVLTHGWPSSFVEFLEVVGPLTDPVAHGGEPADAFDVIIPSLPGFGYSPAPSTTGTGPGLIADLWVALVAALGYERVIAHGGDWGAYVSALMARQQPRRVRGLHLTMLPLAPPREADVPTPDAARAARRQARIDDQSGYSHIQRTRPASLAYGLTDSPAGLAGWVIEKWREWSDCGGDLLSTFSMEHLLTNLSIYWFTGSIGSSVRLYHESPNGESRLFADERIEVPTGVARFPAEGVPSRERFARAFDVVHWTELPRGGHFPALEQPGALVADIRRFARSLHG